MLRILGSAKNLCNGLTRREMLRAGGLGLLGIGLADYLRLADLQAAQPAHRLHKSFGRAKSCILLYLYGAPSQLETFDMKPAAPVEIRGELKPIRSSLPGLDVCELLPNAARVMDRVTVVRSLTHPYPMHGVAYALTGVPQIDVPMELNPRDPRHWPFIGSVVDYLSRQKPRRKPQAVPNNIGLPFPFSSAPRRRGRSRRPLCRLPGQRLQPDLDRLPRPGHPADGQDAARAEDGCGRAVHGHHAGQPFRAGDGHRPAARHHAGSARQPALAGRAVRPGAARSARHRRRP